LEWKEGRPLFAGTRKKNEKKPDPKKLPRGNLPLKATAEQKKLESNVLLSTPVGKTYVGQKSCDWSQKMIEEFKKSANT